MTHEYTILTGGTVIVGGDAPDARAIAWAHDTILFVGSDDDARAISRGDSHFYSMGGAFVVGEGLLETGTPASFSVLDGDPRVGAAHPPRTLALVRGGRVTEGSLRDLTARSR